MDIWTPEEEARRLGERFARLTETQASFARRHAIPGGPSMVTQHLKGRRPLSLQAALAYAVGFGVTLRDISPRLAQMTQQAATLSDKAHGLSLPLYTIPPRKTASELQGERVTTKFAWVIEDDAIEGYVAGWTAIIDPLRTPKVGSVILVRLAGGDVKLRRYAEGLSGWQARADREGYVTLSGTDVALLGTSRGVLDLS